MSVRHSFPYSLLPSGRQAGFMALILLVSLLAHLFIIEWARDSLALVSLLDDEEEVIQVTLHTPPSPTVERAAPLLPRPASPAPEPSTASPPAPSPDPGRPADTPTAAQETNTDTAPSTQAANASDSIADPVVAPTAETAPAPVPVPPVSTAPAEMAPVPAAASNTPPLFVRVSLPPSADLSYDAIAIKGNSKVEGRGLVKWVQDGRQYSLSGEASVLFLSVLSYRSEGHLNELGILPERYVEKRLGKSSTHTHFHRERQTISFSASTNSYPVKGGEQDRGSVFWQLAGLARGNPEKLQAGLSFDLIIAGSRTAEPWRVTIQGLETVALARGGVDAWHMTVVRQEGGAEYQLEVWIAPAQDWYPVKIMYVDRKGTSLGLSLSALEKK